MRQVQVVWTEVLTPDIAGLGVVTHARLLAAVMPGVALPEAPPLVQADTRRGRLAIWVTQVAELPAVVQDERAVRVGGAQVRGVCVTIQDLVNTGGVHSRHSRWLARSASTCKLTDLSLKLAVWSLAAFALVSHKLAVARQRVIFGTLALAGIETRGSIFADTLKLAADSPHLALPVMFVVMDAHCIHFLQRVRPVKFAHRLQATFSRFLLQLTLIRQVEETGALVVTDVLTLLCVCAFTLVGASVVPLVALIILSTLVETFVDNSDSLTSRATVAAESPAVLPRPLHATSGANLDAIPGAVWDFVHTRGRHSRSRWAADAAALCAVRGGKRLVKDTN